MTFSEAAMIMMSGGSKVIQPIAITQYGDYEIKVPEGVDGYNPIHVNLKDRYQAGYTDGWMKCFLNIKTITITKNGTYYAKSENLEGYNPVVVDVPDRYDKGHADGEAAVKAKIQSKTITKNGTYYAADDGLYGFDPVNVNVPDRYDDGYADGYNASYDTSFSTASEYYNDPDLSKNYYVYIGLEGDAQKAIFCHWYDTADMKAQQPQMCWIDGMAYSYDPKIISIKWVKGHSGYVLKIKAKGYNLSHTETKTITFTYTGLPKRITPSNTTIGRVSYRYK